MLYTCLYTQKPLVSMCGISMHFLPLSLWVSSRYFESLPLLTNMPVAGLAKINCTLSEQVCSCVHGVSLPQTLCSWGRLQFLMTLTRLKQFLNVSELVQSFCPSFPGVALNINVQEVISTYSRFAH